MIPKSCCFKCEHYGINQCDDSFCYAYGDMDLDKCMKYKYDDIKFKTSIEEPEAEGGLTLGKLKDCLVAFCMQYPELIDKPVAIASECGYAGAGIAVPFCVAVNQDYDSASIRILTNDDGYTGNYLFYVEE